MEVRVGVTQTAKEIHLEMPDGTDGDKLAKEVETALSKETGVLWLTDRKGRKVGVPAGKVAYVDIGTAADVRPVGFAR